MEYGIFGDAGVGVYANDDVEEEETVCAVPARICLSYPVAYEWIKGFLWFEPESKVHKGALSWHVSAQSTPLTRHSHADLLALCQRTLPQPQVLLEAVLWCAFGSPTAISYLVPNVDVDALPDEYTLPLFWSEKTLTLLNGTPMRCAFPTLASLSCTQPLSGNDESAARAASQL